MGAEIKDPSSSAPRTSKDTIMCRGHNNGIFRIELILRATARNLSPIMDENFFFYSDHLILETKFNKNDLKALRFLKNSKTVPQSEKS